MGSADLDAGQAGLQRRQLRRGVEQVVPLAIVRATPVPHPSQRFVECWRVSLKRLSTFASSFSNAFCAIVRAKDLTPGHFTFAQSRDRSPGRYLERNRLSTTPPMSSPDTALIEAAESNAHPSRRHRAVKRSDANVSVYAYV